MYSIEYTSYYIPLYARRLHHEDAHDKDNIMVPVHSECDIDTYNTSQSYIRN